MLLKQIHWTQIGHSFLPVSLCLLTGFIWIIAKVIGLNHRVEQLSSNYWQSQLFNCLHHYLSYCSIDLHCICKAKLVQHEKVSTVIQVWVKPSLTINICNRNIFDIMLSSRYAQWRMYAPLRYTKIIGKCCHLLDLWSTCRFCSRRCCLRNYRKKENSTQKGLSVVLNNTRDTGFTIWHTHYMKNHQ